jgi:hypothetical protein
MLPGWYAGRTSVYSFSSIQFELDFTGVCNLYSITTNRAAIIALFRVMNRDAGNLPPMPG